MPPLVQVVFERLERVIGCGHVSGLLLRGLIQPRAGMAMRGSEADQQTELVGSSTSTAFSDPDLVDPLPLLFSDLLTLVTRRGGMESAVRLRHRRHGVPVIFSFRSHGPEATGHFVGNCNRDNHARLSSPHARQPATTWRAKPFDGLKNCHCTRDQKRADVTLLHFRRLTQSAFAAS
jgi:hypothetical protein